MSTHDKNKPEHAYPIYWQDQYNTQIQGGFTKYEIVFKDILCALIANYPNTDTKEKSLLTIADQYTDFYFDWLKEKRDFEKSKPDLEKK